MFVGMSSIEEGVLEGGREGGEGGGGVPRVNSIHDHVHFFHQKHIQLRQNLVRLLVGVRLIGDDI